MVVQPTEQRMLGLRPMYLLLLILLVISGLRVWLIVAEPVDLSGDEAHYWEWSRRLDVNYYSKPPGIAWLIWSGTQVLGDTPLGVRGWAVVLSALGSIVLFKLGSEMYNEYTGFWAGLLLQMIPLFAAYGVGMTPDSPLIFFWIVSLYFFYRACETGRRIEWVLLGISLGMGLLVKYTIVFFFFAAILYLAFSPKRRKILASPWPWLCFVIALLFLTPVLVWNSQHDWVNFRHVGGQVVEADGDGPLIRWNTLGEFVGGQVGIISPILFFMMIWTLIVRRKQDPFNFWFSVPILLVFLLRSVQGRVQPNWPLVAYVTGLLSLARWIFARYPYLRPSLRPFVKVGVAIAIIMSVFLYNPALASDLGAPPEYDPSVKIRGWKDLAAEVTDLYKEMPGPTFIVSDYYMSSSALAFYVEDQPVVYCYNPGFRRMNQYDLWPGFGHLVGYNSIYVSDLAKLPPDFKAAFEHTKHKELGLLDSRGRRYRTFHIWQCYGFKGMKIESPHRY